jgi:hypothetical protein
MWQPQFRLQHHPHQTRCPLLAVLPFTNAFERSSPIIAGRSSVFDDQPSWRKALSFPNWHFLRGNKTFIRRLELPSTHPELVVQEYSAHSDPAHLHWLRTRSVIYLWALTVNSAGGLCLSSFPLSPLPCSNKPSRSASPSSHSRLWAGSQSGQRVHARFPVTQETVGPVRGQGCLTS